MENLNFNDVSYLIGIVVSLLSEHVPRIKEVLDKYTPKQRFFGQLLVVGFVVLLVNLLSCEGYALYQCLDWQVLIDAVVSWSIGQLVHWSKKDIIT